MSREIMVRAQVTADYAVVDIDLYNAEQAAVRAEALAKARFKTEWPGNGNHFGKLRERADAARAKVNAIKNRLGL